MDWAGRGLGSRTCLYGGNGPLDNVVSEVNGMDWAGRGLGSRTRLGGAERATKQCGRETTRPQTGKFKLGGEWGTNVNGAVAVGRWGRLASLAVTALFNGARNKP